MNRDEFLGKYHDISRRALAFAETARRKGLLAMEDDLDQIRINDRDIFEYGIRFVVDGIDEEIIKKILTNLIKQEKDENIYLLKKMQREAVLAIAKGVNPVLLHAILNSYVDVTLREDHLEELVEE
jgi:flagellar motor component MotA